MVGRTGRKPGSLNLKTRAIATKAAEEGITPLEVMLEAMCHFRGQGNLAEASRIARDAAPYMHPRLASITHGTRDGQALLEQQVVVLGGVLIKAEAEVLGPESKQLEHEQSLPPTAPTSDLQSDGGNGQVIDNKEE